MSDGSENDSDDHFAAESPELSPELPRRVRQKRRPAQDLVDSQAEPGSQAPDGSAPSAKTKKKIVAISQELGVLLLRVHNNGGIQCFCKELGAFKAGMLITAAIAEKTRRKQAGEPLYSAKAPTNKVTAVAWLCRVHYGQLDEITGTLKPDRGHRDLPSLYTAMMEAKREEWKDAHRVPVGLSVLQAYLFYLIRVRGPTIPAGENLSVLFDRLVPRMLRDLVANHNWSIVEGFYRTGLKGTERADDGLANLEEFTQTMVLTRRHYCGDHAHCGLSRTDVVCVATVPVEPGNAVIVNAIRTSCVKVCTFINQHRVTDIAGVYPDVDGEMINFFSAL